MAAIVNEGAIKRHFGEEVKLLRKKKGLSQEQLAFDTGMDLTSINEIERGHRSPTLVTIHKIAKALGIKSSVLFQ